MISILPAVAQLCARIHWEGTALHQYGVNRWETHTYAQSVNATCREPKSENEIFLEMGVLRFYARPFFVTTDNMSDEQADIALRAASRP